MHATFVQHWRKLEHPVGEPCPVERSRHAAVCLGYGEPHPQLLVTGGLDADNRVLSDAWILDVQSRHWREVSEGGDGNARMCSSIDLQTCYWSLYLGLGVCMGGIGVMMW